MPELDELSISDAFDKGLDTAPEAPDNGSSPSGEEGQPDLAPEEGENGEDKTPEDNPEAPPEQGKPEDQKEIVDPENAKYVGEYKKERFDKLMSAWQQDRAERLKLERDLAEARRAPAQPAAPQTPPQQDYELPLELKDADDATKAGFKIMMNAVQAKFDKDKQDILRTVMDKVTEPERKETEVQTKILDEIRVLSVELGDDFVNNKKEIINYAIENDYPMGTLKQAARSYLREQSLIKGKQTVEVVENKRKKDADLAGQGKSRVDVIPKFDPSRDGSKSMEDIWAEAERAL